MIDQMIAERARNLINAQTSERREQLEYEISRDLGAKNKANELYSSGASASVQKLCANELKIRAMLAWQQIRRVHSILGMHLGETLAADLKDLMKECINADAAGLTRVMKDRTKNIPGASEISLIQASEHAIQKASAEIDLYVDDLRQHSLRRNVADRSSQSVYNFYAPIGAVQTGALASANIFQQLGPEGKDALLNALELVSQALATVERLADYPKGEVVELVDEARGEISKPKPNGMKLRTTLSVVAQAIQTAASLQPAYQALKVAMLPLGITLP